MAAELDASYLQDVLELRGISPLWLAASMSRWAVSSSSIRSGLRSSERYTRETREVKIIAAIKNEEMMRPSGLCISFATRA